MFLRSAIVGLILFFSLTNIKSQTQNSLLWEISGNGLSQPSYIYGTIHQIAKSDFVVRKEIDSVFDLCKQVAFEIKLDDTTLLSTYRNWIYLPEGKTLRDYCTEEEYLILNNYLSDHGQIDIELIKYQKPFVLAQMQTSDYITGETASYELYFFDRLTQNNIPLFGLETMQEELDVFDSMPYDHQIDMVLGAIDSTRNMQVLWSDLITAYKKEDLDALYGILLVASPELMEYENLFISGRNANWIPEMENLIRENTTFIAVGAAHLPGSKGIVHLLENKGYILKPIY